MRAVSQEEPSDRKPDPWPLWMAGHTQLKFVMTECSKTQIRLTGLNYCYQGIILQQKNILCLKQKQLSIMLVYIINTKMTPFVYA